MNDGRVVAESKASRSEERYTGEVKSNVKWDNEGTHFLLTLEEERKGRGIQKKKRRVGVYKSWHVWEMRVFR
jgi:hypothetical protein